MVSDKKLLREMLEKLEESGKELAIFADALDASTGAIKLISGQQDDMIQALIRIDQKCQRGDFFGILAEIRAIFTEIEDQIPDMAALEEQILHSKAQLEALHMKRDHAKALEKRGLN